MTMTATPLTDTTADESIRIGLTIDRRHDGKWEIADDFRADFPEAQDAYGNNTIAEELRRRVKAAGLRGITIDSEFSCLWIIGPNATQVHHVENLLYEMRDDGVLGSGEPQSHLITAGLVPNLAEITVLIEWLRSTDAEITMVSMRRDGLLVVQWFDAHGDGHTVVEGESLTEGNKVDSDGAFS